MNITTTDHTYIEILVTLTEPNDAKKSVRRALRYTDALSTSEVLLETFHPDFAGSLIAEFNTTKENNS